MPLMYVPLIMYASLMGFMAQPFRVMPATIDQEARDVFAAVRRSDRPR